MLVLVLVLVLVLSLWWCLHLWLGWRRLRLGWRRQL